MKTDYFIVKIAINEEYQDLAMSVLMDYDFAGVEQNYDELIVSFTTESYCNINIDELIAEIKEILPETQLNSVEKISDRNWNEEWEKHVQPVIVSEQIAITPTHHSDNIDAQIKIIIDPKMSFGTGHHNTTRLMCKLMEKINFKDKKWIDVGTGTGVLAILAAKLGAEYIYAFDNNEWSVENAVENIEKNAVSDKIKIELEDIENVEFDDYDGVAANIFLNLVIPSLKKFKMGILKRNGDLLISGIMIYDEQQVIDEATKAGLVLADKIYEDEWVAFHFRIKDN